MKNILVSACVSILLLGCGSSDENRSNESTEPKGLEVEVSSSVLKSMKVTSLPVLDGMDNDSVWSGLPKLEIEVYANLVYRPEGAEIDPSYPGLEKTKVTLKSVYNDSEVVFLATWADPTKSLARFPWEKQGDGSWKQLQNKDSSGHDNTYYEDKFAMQWNIDSPTFSASACYASCHAATDNAHPARKYNPNNETTDMWHWKSVRTGPNNQLDDKFISYIASGLCKGENCRIGDSKDSGGYKDNNFKKFQEGCLADDNGSKVLPCFMDSEGTGEIVNDKYWIKDEEKIEFVDNFNVGDQVAGMITTAFVGNRGDVGAVAEYANGKWTLEMKRALITQTPDQDVQFNDLSKDYEFGIAVFDNAQINHAAHAGVLKLHFNP